MSKKGKTEDKELPYSYKRNLLNFNEFLFRYYRILTYYFLS
jgi:hypothetical protein